MRNFFAITSSESIHRIKPAAVCSTTAPLPQAFQHFNRLLAEESPHKPFKPKALSTQPLENDYEVPKSTHHRAFQNQGSTWLLKQLSLSKSNYTQGTAIAAKLVPIDPNPLKSHVLLVPPSFTRYCALTWQEGTGRCHGGASRTPTPPGHPRKCETVKGDSRGGRMITKTKDTKRSREEIGGCPTKVECETKATRLLLQLIRT